MSRFLSTLVPHLLFNRHDVAEGVRRYSLETWQLVMAGEGPAWVARCIDPVLALHLELQSIIPSSANICSLLLEPHQVKYILGFWPNAF